MAKGRNAFVGLVALALLVARFAPAAQADALCTYDAVAQAVTIDVPQGASIVLSRNDVGVIVLGGVACGDSTVTNTDSIAIVGSSGAEQAAIDLTSGPLAPGATAEPTGVSDIEISVDIGTAEDGDLLRVVGGPGDDNIVFGASTENAEFYANLNGDDDADVTISPCCLTFYEISGGIGNDTLSAAGGGAAGPDPLWIGVTILGGEGSDNISGGGGNDALSGGLGNDAVTGGGGVDTLAGGPGDDALDGGGPDQGDEAYDRDDPAPFGDISDFSAASGAVTASLGTGTATGEGADTLTGFEGLQGSAHNDHLIGDAAANDLIGGGGSNDLRGGGGFDRVSYGWTAFPVQVNLASGSASVGGSTDTLAGIEDVAGSRFGDQITGDGAGNWLFGQGGNDVINGGGAADKIFGGEGADRMNGAAGDDWFYGAGGRDTFSGGLGDDFLNLDYDTCDDVLDYSAARHSIRVAGNTVTGEGRDEFMCPFAPRGPRIIGSRFADRFTGDLLMDNFEGGPGADVFRTRGGADRILGGAGNDTIDSGSGRDTVAAGPGNDRVYLRDGAIDIASGDAGRDCARKDASDHVRGFERAC